MAAGLPVVLLLNILGGVDLGLIVLAYAGLATTAFFLASLSIWVSSGAPDGRRAVNVSVLWILAWLVVPFFLPMILGRFGLRLPAWALTVNSWLMASSPLGLAMKLVMGIGASRGLIDAVAWMGGLQVGGTVLFLVGSMARLRFAYRANVSGEGRARGRVRLRPVWRFRPRPAVGDDPILWREMHTARGNLLLNAVGSLINLTCLAALGYATYYFAKPAVLEVWQHGYAPAVSSGARPEFNLFVRMFLPGGSAHEPVDVARTAFNLFLRYVTATIAFLLTLIAAGAAADVLARERAKQTWTSLLATPLTGRDILRAALRAAAWRLRELLTVVWGLWTIGLIAGAIHPLGYLVAMMELAATTWFFVAFGALGAIRAQDASTAHGLAVGLPMVLIGSATLPFLLPGRLSSALLGAGSPPFVIWLSLLSYRDVQTALSHSSYPHLQWIGIGTGEGPLRVLAACLIGIVAAALGGWWVWRYALAHFDRLVGRPWKGTSVPADGVPIPPPAPSWSQ
jgi:hypothetical protein